MSQTNGTTEEVKERDVLDLEPLNDPNKVRFVLVGPNKGKSVILGGFEFVNGVHTTLRDYEIAVSNIVTRYYDCIAERDLPAFLDSQKQAKAKK